LKDPAHPWIPPAGAVLVSVALVGAALAAVAHGGHITIAPNSTWQAEQIDPADETDLWNVTLASPGDLNWQIRSLAGGPRLMAEGYHSPGQTEGWPKTAAVVFPATLTTLGEYYPNPVGPGTYYVRVQAVEGYLGNGLYEVRAAFSPSTGPKTLYVRADAAGAQDGTSWIDAYTDVQEALHAAGPGDAIWVAQGSYKPDRDTQDRNSSFALVNDVKLYGGFPPDGGDWSQRDPVLYETILTGDLNGDDGPDGSHRADNCYHVVRATQVTSSALLDGFTVQAGNADGDFNSGDAQGGGMVIDAASPTVVHCSFYRNLADARGGAVYIRTASAPTIEDCTFDDNESRDDGGGIYVDCDNSLALAGCSFSRNAARFFGGAVFYNCQSGSSALGCTFAGNAAGYYGGAIFFTAGTLALTDCALNGNTAPEGAAIYSWSGSLELEDSLFRFSELHCPVLRLLGAETLHLAATGTMVVDNDIVVGQQVLVTGGDIVVPSRGRLLFADQAVLDLNTSGALTCHGTLVAQDSATIRNTSITVTRMSLEDNTIIANNVITAEAGSPYGQFFIDDAVAITGNDIHADGDRYMDLDPAVFGGLVADNRIYVTISEGAHSRRGGLLELRGRDFASPPCAADSFCCQAEVPEFTTATWTIERLELLEGAKLNLTNRFDFGNGSAGGYDEVLYVKELVLQPHAMLNTAFHHLYYEDFVGDPNGIKNEPMLGFSLHNIACNDEEEFLTRVVTNNYRKRSRSFIGFK